MNVKETINDFHQVYYTDRDTQGVRIWDKTFWRGVKVHKTPLDLWIYQEIIFEQRPDLIIETGTTDGGSAIFMADLLNLNGLGSVVTVDVNSLAYHPMHKRVKYLTGLSTDLEVIEKIETIISDTKATNIMVVLDSDYRRDHVFKELELYNHFVSLGNYLIVERSDYNGHPIYPESGPGPMEAINDFLKINSNFRVDKTREKFLLTFNPSGYLRRIS